MDNQVNLMKKLNMLLERIKKLHPEQASLVDAFTPLARLHIELTEEWKATRHREKKPFTIHTLPITTNEAVQELDRISRALAQGFPKAKAPLQKVTSILEQRPCPIKRLCQATLSKDHKKIVSYARKHGLDQLVDTMLLLLGQVSKTLATKAAMEVSVPDNYASPRCPICGSKPDFSMILGKEGSRHLHCSLCGHSWRYSRTACACCGADTPGNLTHISVDAIPEEHAECCATCHGYVLALDGRGEDAPPEILHYRALGMAHLDILAQEEGSRPCAEM